MNAPIHHTHIQPTTAPGFRLAQYALARSIACKERCDVLLIAQRLFSGDAAAIAVARAASGSADTQTAGWAAELVRADTRMLLADIAPISAFARLATAGTQVSFNDAMAIAAPAVPWIDPAMEGAWCGEGATLPVLRGVVSGARIPRRKLAGIVAVSKELESNDGVEAMRIMLRMGAANLLDRSVFDASPAVAFVRPAGLLHGVTMGSGAAGGGIAAMTVDIATLNASLNAAGCGANVWYVINSGTLAAINVAPLGTTGDRFIGTPMVAPDTVIAIDTAYFCSAADPIELDISGGAVLTMGNADAVAPTQAMDVAGAIGTAHEVPPDRGISVHGGVSGVATAGYQAVSMLQTYSLAVRLVWPVGYAMTLPGSVQGLTGITWAAAPAP